MPKRKIYRPNSSSWSDRQKAILLLALLVSLLLVLAFWPKKDTALARAQAGAETGSVDVRQSPAGPAVPIPVATADPGPSGPVIDQVTVEKKEVCQGEDNMITVHAHTEDGTDAFLNYVIDGKRGSSVPLRLLTANGDHSIEVFGRNKVVTTVPVPYFKVKDCKAPYLAEVQVKLQPNSWGDYDFVATVGPFHGLMALPKPPLPFVPIRFEWSFGDGEKETTTVSTVSHSYEGRRQETAFSYMDVSVKIYSDMGDAAVARTSLALSNPAFEALAQKGIVTLLIALDPRFPEIDDQGHVVQHVKLWHASPAPVTIESAIVTQYYADGRKGRESAPKPVDVGTLLGTTTIPPGKDGVHVEVTLDTSEDPTLFSATYRLAGKSANGEPVMGSFSVMRPPPTPTADHSDPVTDPVLKAKIIATREILKKDIVNDQEIAMLEEQGKFVDLDLGATQGAPSPVPHSGPGESEAPLGAARGAGAPAVNGDNGGARPSVAGQTRSSTTAPPANPVPVSSGDQK